MKIPVLLLFILLFSCQGPSAQPGFEILKDLKKIEIPFEFKNNLNCTSATCTSPDHYTPTPFRSSDHDPVLVGLALGTPALDIDDSAPTTQYDAATDGDDRLNR